MLDLSTTDVENSQKSLKWLKKMNIKKIENS